MLCFPRDSHSEALAQQCPQVGISPGGTFIHQEALSLVFSPVAGDTAP